MARANQFTAGIIILIAIEILKVYFIMPFPGSQESDTIDIAYFLHNNAIYLRLIGILLILFPSIYYFKFGSRRSKIAIGLSLIVYVTVLYFFNYKFAADHMFYQPEHKLFAKATENKIPGRNIVIGVNINGIA